jgi:hypothetical protein
MTQEQMMNQVPDPTGGWAKATEATANASKEAIQAGRDLARFLREPAGEVIGMVSDYLTVVRFERQIRLSERVRHFVAERGMDAPTRRIAPNIALPLLENASLEEDHDLQDVWARLLVNGGDAHSGIELHPAFGAVLAQMTAFDVRNLAHIDSASKLAGRDAELGIWTFDLPEAAVAFLLARNPGDPSYPSPEVKISLSNLARLGCISSLGERPDGPQYILVNLIPFGQAFIEACTK